MLGLIRLVISQEERDTVELKHLETQNSFCISENLVLMIRFLGTQQGFPSREVFSSANNKTTLNIIHLHNWNTNEVITVKPKCNYLPNKPQK